MQKNKQINKDPFSYVCDIQEVLAGGKHFEIVYIKTMMILL